jgi:transcriptional regulator with XRE-family HTH domain
VNAVDHIPWLPMDFPDRLAELRKARNLTQQALADQVGVHLTQIQRYEKGESQPTLDIIRQLAIALTVSADTLLFDRGERDPEDHLRLQFEAIKQFDPDDRQLAEGVLEGLILKHQAKRLLMRPGAKPQSRAAITDHRAEPRGKRRRQATRR